MFVLMPCSAVGGAMLVLHKIMLRNMSYEAKGKEEEEELFYFAHIYFYLNLKNIFNMSIRQTYERKKPEISLDSFASSAFI